MTNLSEQYVIVTEDENEQPIELPAEPDGTLLLSTLAAQFNGASGLKYENSETKTTRGVRLADGRLHPPDGVWGNRLYVTVFPKGVGWYCGKRPRRPTGIMRMSNFSTLHPTHNSHR